MPAQACRRKHAVPAAATGWEPRSSVLVQCFCAGNGNCFGNPCPLGRPNDRALHAGVLTSDPRIVPNTRPVTQLTFDEATELAFFGAQVLHPQAMQPAVRSGTMGVRVKNSYNRRVPMVGMSFKRRVVVEWFGLSSFTKRPTWGWPQTALVQRQPGPLGKGLSVALRVSGHGVVSRPGRA